MSDTLITCPQARHGNLNTARDEEPSDFGTPHTTHPANGPAPGTCRSWGDCKAFDPATKQGCATRDPLCPACLESAERDVPALIYDYVDLEQLHEAALSQAINEKTSGSAEAAMLIAAHVEALQAEMVHVSTTWEEEVRYRQRLADPHAPAPVASWNTTITLPVPPSRVRAGVALQRAVGILTPRLPFLSRLEPVAVCPTGSEDDWQDVAGWQAIHHLQHLHKRARAALGRTRRTFWIPGACWACEARPTPGDDGPLWRGEPRFEHDPMQVECGKCRAYRPYADYEVYEQTLRWPLLTDEQAAA